MFAATAADVTQRPDRRAPVLIDNIGTLVTNDPELGTIKDAALVFDDGLVAWAGPRARRQRPREPSASTREGRAVIPGFVDSHGHLVFAGDRAEEFAARMEGRPYTRRRHQDDGRRRPAPRATSSSATTSTG